MSTSQNLTDAVAAGDLTNEDRLRLEPIHTGVRWMNDAERRHHHAFQAYPGAARARARIWVWTGAAARWRAMAPQSRALVLALRDIAIVGAVLLVWAGLSFVLEVAA